MTPFAALAIFLLLIIVPGLGASLALYRPAEIPVASRIALVFAVGWAMVAITSYLLILGRVLYTVPLLTLVGVETIVVWVIAWRRASLVREISAFPRRIRAAAPSNVLGLLTVGSIAILAHESITAFRARIPYRYWSDGLQISRLHEIPSATVEYGALYPTVASKVLLDAFAAAVSPIVREPNIAVGPLLWIATLGTAVALWACAREMGLRATAPAAAVAAALPVYLGYELTVDLDAYRAEAFGRVIAFTALAFGVRAIHSGRLRDAIVGGLLLMASAASHLVPTLFVCLLLVGFGLGKIIIERLGGLKMLARQSVVLIAGAVVGYGLIVAAPTTTGLGGPSAAAEYRVGFPSTFDPTAFLTAGVPSLHPATSSWYRTPRQVVTRYLAGALDGSYWSRLDGSWLVVIALGTLALALAVLLLAKARFRYIPLACWTASALSIAIALYFARRYDLYTLATFGMRRLFDYSILIVILGVAAIVEFAVGPLRRFRTWAPTAVALALTSIFVAASLRDYARYHHPQEPAAIPLLSWIRENTPCDARLVANARTVGVFRVMTGRTSITEGMGPFLRPVMLRRLVPLLEDSRAFYDDPNRERDFLRRYDIDYVVVVRHLAIGYGAPSGRANEEAFRSAPNLQLVKDAPKFSIYRVLESDVPERHLPQRYPCRTTPVSY